MDIKNKDLNLLIRIENFLGTNFPRGSEGQNLAWDLCPLNEKLIIQRQEQRGTREWLRRVRKQLDTQTGVARTSFVLARRFRRFQRRKSR